MGQRLNPVLVESVAREMRQRPAEELREICGLFGRAPVGFEPSLDDRNPDAR